MMLMDASQESLNDPMVPIIEQVHQLKSKHLDTWNGHTANNTIMQTPSESIASARRALSIETKIHHTSGAKSTKKLGKKRGTVSVLHSLRNGAKLYDRL